MTGYRRGDKVKCGRDATGYKLFARSATQCAYSGHDWRQILRTYYGPGLDIVGGGGTSSTSTTTDSQPTTTQPNLGDAAAATAGRTPATMGAGSTIPRPVPEAVETSFGFGGAATGGLGSILALPTVPTVPTVRPFRPFRPGRSSGLWSTLSWSSRARHLERASSAAR